MVTEIALMFDPNLPIRELEEDMRFVKVQYDAYSQQFNLMERELTRDLEDGGTYLIADSSTEDFLPVDRSKRLMVDSETGKRLGVA
jgi:hypothetical protein